MIKVSYGTKDEIPSGLEDHYTEKDGKWMLQAEGMKTQSDVDNVKSALTKERELKKAAESKVAAYDGIESDGLRAQLDELARLRTTGGKVDDSKIEDIVAERLKLDKESHAREIEKLTTTNTQLQGVNDNLVNEKHTSMIEKALRDASAGKVNETAMNDVLFRSSLFEVSEDNKVLTKENSGVTPGLEPQQWLDEQLPTNTHWQNTSKGAGAKGSGKGANGNSGTGSNTIAQEVASQVQFN